MQKFSLFKVEALSGKSYGQNYRCSRAKIVLEQVSISGIILT